MFQKRNSIINKIDAKNYINGQETISILNIYFHIEIYKYVLNLNNEMKNILNSVTFLYVKKGSAL